MPSAPNARSSAATLGPYRSASRAGSSPSPREASARRPSIVSAKRTPGWASASRLRWAATLADSVRADARNFRLAGRDALAVVGHAEQLQTPAEQLDADVGGARVQRVVDQLADDRHGPFHDLAGRDLLHHLGWQHLDAAGFSRGRCEHAPGG